MNTLPNISSYGNYASSNYGAHSLRVNMGSLTLYFSYETIIAFRTCGRLICSENVWSTTTGRHLNRIEPDKKQRVSHKGFEAALIKILKHHKLT